MAGRGKKEERWREKLTKLCHSNMNGYFHFAGVLRAVLYHGVFGGMGPGARLRGSNPNHLHII